MANTRVWHMQSFILCILGCMFCVVGRSNAQQAAGSFGAYNATLARAAAGAQAGVPLEPNIPRGDASSADLASIPEDTCWYDGFSGFEYSLRSIAVSGSVLYAVSGLVAGKWDGRKWTRLGTGGPISTVAVFGGDVYIGGNFTNIADVPAARVARWDGNAWKAVGGGFNNEVCALLVHDGALYAGGRFTTAGGSPARHLARWNGSAWSEVAGGIDSTVLALCEYRNGIVAGGDFRKAGAVSARRIARLEGGQWYAFEEGTDGPVNALTARGDDLYAGGEFLTAGITAANNIAKWNGSAWSALGAGTNKAVLSLLAVDTMIYVGGKFDSPNRHLARWGGSAWIGQAAFGGVNGDVTALGVLGTDLFVGGGFYQSYTWDGDPALTCGGCIVWNLARRYWSAPMLGYRNPVSSLIAADDSLYICSNEYVMRWTAGTYRKFGLAVYPVWFWTSVRYKNALIAAGQFVSPWNWTLQVKNVMQLQADTWTALGAGLSMSDETKSRVWALDVIDTVLYAGGNFDRSGQGNYIKMVAAWNGVTWTKLGSGMDAEVYALANDGKNLYAGGAFRTAGGIQANRVARWDGVAWSALGSGMNANVDVLAWMDGYLYAGGTFTLAGGADVFYIARWDGTRWAAFGDPLDGNVTTMAVVDRELVVSGTFMHAGNLTVNRIAGWNGTRWRTYGSGLDAPATAIAAARNGAMFLGGEFSLAGGKSSWHLARWSPSGSFTAVPVSAPLLFRLEQSYPNPVRPSSEQSSAIISYSVDAPTHVSLRVYDPLGRQISTLVDQRMEPGDHRCEFRADALPSGVYYYRLEGFGKSIVKKLLVQR
ncbi:MAG: T9SS type A sorting domain-containing protein [Ignavibacteria bacterium]|nr:T9SS type A sorting domain-containing protein [Ignavibacteria bacterium]